MSRTLLVAVGSVLFLGALGSAQQSPVVVWPQSPSGQAGGVGAPGLDVPLEVKRDWLLGRMLQEFAGTGRSREIQNKVARMTPERVDQLIAVYRNRDAGAAAEAQARLADSAAYRDYMIQQYRARLYASRYPGTAYAPVVTWLPQGTSFSASAVVSPDRRYVRINAAPFFSGIGPVNTFRFAPGW
jgi:hypothetical protein